MRAYVALVQSEPVKPTPEHSRPRGHLNSSRITLVFLYGYISRLRYSNPPSPSRSLTYSWMLSLTSAINRPPSFYTAAPLPSLARPVPLFLRFYQHLPHLLRHPSAFLRTSHLPTPSQLITAYYLYRVSDKYLRTLVKTRCVILFSPSSRTFCSTKCSLVLDLVLGTFSLFIIANIVLTETFQGSVSPSKALKIVSTPTLLPFLLSLISYTLPHDEGIDMYVDGRHS